MLVEIVSQTGADKFVVVCTRKGYLPQYHPDYPLTNSTSLLAMRAVMEWQCSNLTNTIGKEAARNLTKLGVSVWKRPLRR